MARELNVTVVKPAHTKLGLNRQIDAHVKAVLFKRAMARCLKENRRLILAGGVQSFTQDFTRNPVKLLPAVGSGALIGMFSGEIIAGLVGLTKVLHGAGSEYCNQLFAAPFIAGGAVAGVVVPAVGGLVALRVSPKEAAKHIGGTISIAKISDAAKRDILDAKITDLREDVKSHLAVASQLRELQKRGKVSVEDRRREKALREAMVAEKLSGKLLGGSQVLVSTTRRWTERAEDNIALASRMQAFLQEHRAKIVEGKLPRVPKELWMYNSHLLAAVRGTKNTSHRERNLEELHAYLDAEKQLARQDIEASKSLNAITTAARHGSEIADESNLTSNSELQQSE